MRVDIGKEARRRSRDYIGEVPRTRRVENRKKVKLEKILKKELDKIRFS